MPKNPKNGTMRRMVIGSLLPSRIPNVARHLAVVNGNGMHSALSCSMHLTWFTSPFKANPDYKGKWYAPMIDNPAYKGEWAPKKIPNPDFFEDKSPVKSLAKIVSGNRQCTSLRAEVICPGRCWY
jgi:hypothetical protein